MNELIIKSKEEYEFAMIRLLDLMSDNPVPGSIEAEELELLATAIEHYEIIIDDSIIDSFNTNLERLILSKAEKQQQN